MGVFVKKYPLKYSNLPQKLTFVYTIKIAFSFFIFFGDYRGHTSVKILFGAKYAILQKLS